MQQVPRNRVSYPLVGVAIAVIISSFTLLLIESGIKYYLFTFEVAVIIICFILLGTKTSIARNNERFSIKNIRSFTESVPSLLLVGMAITLLILHLYNTNGGMVQNIMAMVSGCILTGYAALNMIGVRRYFSRLEFYVVSFLISIGLTGFLSIGLNFLGGHIQIGLSIIFLIIGIISFLATVLANGKKAINGYRSLSRPVDILAIGVCVGLYLSFAAIVYPNAASLIGTDISRHFSHSLSLIGTPDQYSAPFYLLFHSFQGSIFLLSGEEQPVTLYLSIFVFLNIFLPLSLYAGTKRFLERFDSRIPGLTVIFYTFLSNLSFIYFITLRLVGPEIGPSEYPLVIREVAEKSYFGIINFLQPFNFLTPLTISIIGILVLFTLLKNTSIPKYRYIGIFSFVVISCSLLHVPEVAIFGLLISFYSILQGRVFVRARDSLIAFTIGFFAAAILFGLIDTSLIRRSAILDDNFVLGAFLLPGLASIIALFWDYRRTKSSFTFGNRLHTIYHTSLWVEGITLTILVLYIAGIILWFFIEDLNTSDLILGTGAVPTFLFPVMLGVVGLLAIFSIRAIKNRQHRETILFLLFAILSLFIIGKILSFVNINFIQVPYWEKRIILLIFVFASMLAPIPVTILWDRFHAKQRNRIFSTITLSAIIGSIFLIGFSSLALQLEYWYIKANGEQRLDLTDLDAVNVIRKVVDEHDSLAIISPSEFSRHVTTFAAPDYQLTRQDILLSSNSPQVPLMVLGGLAYDKVYVYIHDRDLDILDTYSNSWFKKHLLPSLPLVYQNEGVKIYNATGLTFPQPESKTLIAIPSSITSDDWLYAYDTVAMSSKNYSEILDQDALSLETLGDVVFPIDPSSSFHNTVDFTSQNVSQDFWKAIGQWEQADDGLYGLGKYSDLTRNRNELISDYFADSGNITLSTLFKIDDKVTNREATSYVSLIFSWKDQTHFDMAGVAFRGDDTYAYFAKVRNSGIALYPQFPYSAPLITGLKWDGGSLVNMTFSRKGDVEDLYLNGTKYLSQTVSEKSKGFVGIGTSGANNFVFKELSYFASRPPSVPFDHYYDYVADGGNLTVYNTNGYGTIFDLLKIIHSEYDNEQNRNDPLPMALSSSTYQRNGSPTSSPQAIGNSDLDYRVINAKLGQGNIRYLDIYSLIRNESLSEKDKYTLLKNITRGTLNEDYELTDFNLREIPMIFQNMDAEGDIQATASSIWFPNGVYGGHLDVQGIGNYSQHSIRTNITRLSFNEYDGVSVRSNNITLVGSGSGTYVDLILRENQTINLDFDKAANIEAWASDGSRIGYENVSSIEIESGLLPVSVAMKAPVIRIDGNVQFGKLYGGRLAGVVGQDVNFNGNISFAIRASDTYSLTENVTLNGIFDTPSEKYDEISMLTTSTFLLDIISIPPMVMVLLSIPVILGAVFFLYKRIY